ncbi:transcriptional regulator, AraC family [Nannocystis exedens]|uniref:Transcriptional regulator, AraC family n=1 Tax=Nannocystis exedens TaxID=54 RepID=A0A1I2CA91_9BACT|nr:AraC family transcriptional regulator [Nannocystis exedens]PCC68426.1 HTH-type transcriptional activator Btr [Nannocystis exedens]SFE65251.1 transcriptional regulator, AraC family [Nannocystis exedens]
MTATATLTAHPPLAPRLALETFAAGLATLPACADHRVHVHVGRPARGECRNHRFVHTPGEIDVFPAGTADEWHQADVSTALVVSLTPALMRRAAEATGRDPDRFEVHMRHQIRDPQIEHIVRALDAERAAGHPGGPLFGESLGLALAVRLLGPVTAPPAPARGLTPQQLRAVTAYIEEHLDRDLSLATLADVAGISASHFKTLFRRSLGLPVHTYVIHRRVDRARALLLRGRMAASQVALEVGFSHQSHMARCMRRVLGVTPTSLTRAATPARPLPPVASPAREL